MQTAASLRLTGVWITDKTDKNKSAIDTHLFLLIEIIAILWIFQDKTQLGDICKSFHQSADCFWPVTGFGRAVFHCSLAEGGTPNGQTVCFFNLQYFGSSDSIVPHVHANQVKWSDKDTEKKTYPKNWFSDFFRQESIFIKGPFWMSRTILRVVATPVPASQSNPEQCRGAQKAVSRLTVHWIAQLKKRPKGINVNPFCLLGYNRPPCLFYKIPCHGAVGPLCLFL